MLWPATVRVTRVAEGLLPAEAEQDTHLRGVAVAVALELRHGSRDGLLEAVVNVGDGVGTDQDGLRGVGGVVTKDQRGVEVPAERANQRTVGLNADRLTNTCVHEDVQVAVHHVLDLLIGEDHDGGDLLDVQGALSEGRAGQRLGSAFRDEPGVGLTEPDGEVGATGASGTSVASKLDRARLHQDPVHQDFTLLRGEQVTARLCIGSVFTTCATLERDKVSHCGFTLLLGKWVWVETTRRRAWRSRERDRSYAPVR
jgi:hypothetical protein